ncbi:MAG: hypothetical protein PGN09_02830 [Sphingomonas fennica]
MDFRRRNLEDAGFVGWVPFDLVMTANPCPERPGVYLVGYIERGPERFAAVSCGGWFKGKDPSVPAHVLEANWVEGAEVVYIGKALNLRRRLREFAIFGSGKPIGHWGGRLIWQLGSLSELTIAWMETPHDDPRTIEVRLIAEFRYRYGKPPFANDPHRMGF